MKEIANNILWTNYSEDPWQSLSIRYVPDLPFSKAFYTSCMNCSHTSDLLPEYAAPKETIDVQRKIEE